MQIERSKGKGSKAAGGLYDLYPIAVEGGEEDQSGRLESRLDSSRGGQGNALVQRAEGGRVRNRERGTGKPRWLRASSRSGRDLPRTEKGHIGLQDHGAEVAFKNVKIRVIE